MSLADNLQQSVVPGNLVDGVRVDLFHVTLCYWHSSLLTLIGSSPCLSRSAWATRPIRSRGIRCPIFGISPQAFNVAEGTNPQLYLGSRTYLGLASCQLGLSPRLTRTGQISDCGWVGTSPPMTLGVPLIPTTCSSFIGSQSVPTPQKSSTNVGIQSKEP